jgi:tetratricopeptide (TPR) repeat protein
MTKYGLIIFIWVGILFSQSNLEKGMTTYNRRAEGSIEDQANPKQINYAIEFFQFAMDESKVEAVVGLLKSYYFKGKYIAKTENEKKVIYNSAKELALENLDKYPKNVELHYWYLSNLGSWAEVYGILTAAKEGVADQMKDHALTIIELNPNYEDGGGYFMLGAVHYKSPYIPFFLSWPDNDEAIKWLKKANETGDAKPVQKVYLAQALYKNKEKSSAISLLEEVTNMTPTKVESLADWEQIKKARILLKEYR